MERTFKKQQNEHINSAGVNGSSQKITDNQTRIARGIQECIQIEDSVMDELTGIVVGCRNMTISNQFTVYFFGFFNLVAVLIVVTFRIRIDEITYYLARQM